MTFEEARAQYPVFERLAYLNAGTNGPLARRTVVAMIEQELLDLAEGRSSRAYFDAMLAGREEVRGAFARVLGTDPSLVALVSSTTRACNTVVAGLGLRPEDEVVTTDSEHFGLIGPLHAGGARVRVVEADEDAVRAAVTPRTRLVALSHVLWTTGRRLDVAALRDSLQVPLLVDGAQSAGAIPLELGRVDFYTVSAQKWLCGPDPSGALYVADPERLRVAAPSYPSQVEHEPTGAFTPKEGAARFDSGWIGGPALRGLAEALDAHPDWRYDRARQATAACRELLAPRVEVVPGGATLVAFRPPEEAPADVVGRLAEAGVVVREIPNTGLVRVSCGYWTSDGDLRRLVEAL
jgi:L-cysteine/cystine lyase